MPITLFEEYTKNMFQCGGVYIYIG